VLKRSYAHNMFNQTEYGWITETTTILQLDAKNPVA
jgi:hypothetical protein